MHAQRVWKVVRLGNHQDVGNHQDGDELDKLHAKLAEFNLRIAELEAAHPEKQKIETLKADAIMVARRIDEVRCSGATRQLASLLTR
jgi:uncharacterized protein YydD (DUF2326 family)